MSLLIHETAHAVTEDGHGKRWLARMEKAAHRAAEIGLTTLADLLRKEADEYPEGQALTAATVYDEIYRAAQTQPALHFMDIVAYVACCWGLSADDLTTRFPRAERGFDRARRDAVQSARRRAKSSAPDTRVK